MSDSNTPKPCPFCGAIPQRFDGDYELLHREDCFLFDIGSRWLIGNSRRLEQWNNQRELTQLRAELEAATTRSEQLGSKLVDMEKWGQDNLDFAKQRGQELERARDTFWWLLGLRGDFPKRPDGMGLYWWRRNLRERLGITDAEVNEEAKRVAAQPKEEATP